MRQKGKVGTIKFIYNNVPLKSQIYYCPSQLEKIIVKWKKVYGRNFSKGELVDE